MASLTYDSCLEDEARGNIDYDTDTFYAMLVGSGYTPNKGTHTKRSDITAEVSGTGYTAGGTAVTPTITKDTVNHRLDVAFSNPSWPSSTISNAVGSVIYKRRGGAASADELVAFVEFSNGATSSTNATFSVTHTAPYRKQN